MEPPLGVLDFWLGRWAVRTRDGEPAGIDLVEGALAGYAVLEHWRNVGGVEGKSLFFYDAAAATWKQLWVMQGRAKRKELVLAEPGRVRFDGQAFLEGGVVPDRTTLTAEADGTVSQLIEHSLDGGASWETSFDAVYERLD